MFKCFMTGVNVWWVHLAPQNIPRAISVLTLGNKVILYYYCIVYCIVTTLADTSRYVISRRNSVTIQNPRKAVAVAASMLKHARPTEREAGQSLGLGIGAEAQRPA